MSSTKILIPGVAYYMKHKKSGRYLDGHSKNDDELDKKNQDTGGDGIDNSQEWIFKAIDSNKYSSSCFYLKHPKTGRYLDGHKDDKTVNKKNIDTGKDGLDHSKIWEFKPLNGKYDDYNYLMHSKTGRQLDGKRSDDSVYKQDTGLPNEYQMWSLEFSDLKTVLLYDRVDYGSPQLPNTSQDGIGVQTIINESSSAEAIQRIELSKALTSTFEWSFTESLSQSISSTVNVGLTVPFALSASVSSNTTLSLSSTQAQTNSETITYSCSQEITAPPNTSVRCNGYVDWADNIQSDFTMTLRFSATASGISLNSQQLIQLLDETGSVYKVVSELTNELLISLDGVFDGSYGISTGMTLTDI